MTDDVAPDKVRPIKSCDVRYAAALARRQAVIDNLEAGMPLTQAWDKAGFSESAYRKARQTHKIWASKIDELCGRSTRLPSYAGGAAEFFLEFFGHEVAWFQILWLNEIANMPKGNILVAIWPPEHGKTTLFENYANMKLALEPNHKFIVAAAGQQLAKKILGRVQRRMEPMGPTPSYVRRFGPFAPQFGSGDHVNQPWGSFQFSVFKKNMSDERDWSMEALGVNSEIIGTRPDHLHIDDPQSTKTIGKDTVSTEQLDNKFRQDYISRPGESGIITVNGTIVGEHGWIQTLVDDPMVDAGIMKVIKFPVMGPWGPNGEIEPLWKERNTMESLERTKIKSGARVWDSQYMMNPGASSDKSTTFSGIVEPCKNPYLSLTEVPERGSICYVTLDPALGSKNCVMVLEVRPNKKLIVRRIQERVGLQRNEQIIDELRQAIVWATAKGAIVTDVVVESMNFQKGLVRDERLKQLSAMFGFRLREHLTGINKYEENIGVPSMATSFTRGEIVLPYAPDDYTRQRMDELVRQLHAWKIDDKRGTAARGTRLRQDQVMALWFGWILWQSRWKVARDDSNTDGWRLPALSSDMQAIHRIAQDLAQGVRR